jgi:deoxycytidine triphosphate deaminase
MYLSNKELIAILPEMEISGTDDRFPFEPDRQIQLCSIDLRVSNIFWRQKKVHRIIDLGQKKVFELSPRGEWKKFEIDFDQSIILKPGELLIGRTYESFKIPKNFAGKIIAKSSIARLGISMFCSTDFINPGWFGHCPMVIKNNGIHTVKIHPLLHMCQIIVVSLSSLPDGEFGVGKYASSYQNDDGGPSFWWRDKVFQAIRDDYENKISEDSINELIKVFQKVDDDGLNRFKVFLSKIDTGNISNSSDILSAFANREKRKSRKQRVIKGVLSMLQIALVGSSIKLLLDYPNYTTIHYIFWAIVVATLPFSIWFVFSREEKKYYYDI